MFASHDFFKFFNEFFSFQKKHISNYFGNGLDNGCVAGEAQLHIVKKQMVQAKLFQPLPSSKNKLTTISMYHVQNGKNEMNNKMEFV